MVTKKTTGKFIVLESISDNKCFYCLFTGHEDNHRLDEAYQAVNMVVGYADTDTEAQLMIRRRKGPTPGLGMFSPLPMLPENTGPPPLPKGDAYDVIQSAISEFRSSEERGWYCDVHGLYIAKISKCVRCKESVDNE